MKYITAIQRKNWAKKNKLKAAEKLDTAFDKMTNM